MRDRYVYEQAGCVNVRHDRHKIHRLMVWRFVDFKRIDYAAMIVARIGNASDNGDRDAFDTDSTIKAVNRTNQTRCVARREFEVVLIDAGFVVRVTVEKHIGNVIRLTALQFIHGF